MRVLGISPDVWISSAALIEDGEVVAAIAEERLNRQKMSAAFPHLAIDWCLSKGKCRFDQLDAVAVAWNPGVHLSHSSSRNTTAISWRGNYLAAFPAELMKHTADRDIASIVQNIYAPKSTLNIHYVSHHQAHAASAYYLSGWKNAAILTIDGRGESETCTWSVGAENTISKFQSVSMPHSLGLFYGVFTEFLGFKPDGDEWKVMALAALGKQKQELYERVRALVNLQKNGLFELDLSYFSYYLFDRQPHLFSQKLVELLGEPRARHAEFKQRDYDIALALQLVFEETVMHMLTGFPKKKPVDGLVLAGGAAMNSVCNGKIAKRSSFKNVFVPSMPDDSGVSVGAALAVNHAQQPSLKRKRQRDNFWGPEFSDKEIEEVLKRSKITYETPKGMPKYIAAKIAEGKLVGWFQGREEFGQRALGHRSILADPRASSTKDKVNAAVKYRESFRPFAPAVLAEKAPVYFDIPPGVRVDFMEAVFQAREEFKERLGAVVHFDGSARLQTVNKADNALFYELIEAFGAITGLPVLLNTSFNLNGEPIVSSPADAIRTFYSCGLDLLVLGRFVVSK